MYPKVLVFAPISQVKDYCLPQWLEHISNLTYENYHVYLVDNSDDSNFFKKYADSFPNIDYSWYNPKGLRSQDFIAQSQEKGRQYAINGKFDYIMSIECDVFPPLDVIERLLNHKNDVVCGIYQWGFGDNRKPLIQVAEHFDTHFQNRNMQFDEAYHFVDGTTKDIFHAGIGCALISAKVFYKIFFRSEQDSDAHSDTWFAFDCWMRNFNIVADTSVFCLHDNQAWSYQEELIKNNQNVKIR